jgi:glycosidase
MPWHHEYKWNHDLLEYTKKLVHLRHEYPALRRGAYQTLYAQDGIYAYARTLKDDCFIGIINVNHHEVAIDFHISAKIASGVYQDVFNSASLQVANNALSGATMPARSASLWQHQS